MRVPAAGNCNRQPSPKEVYVNSAGLDDTDVALLEIVRFYLQTFVVESSQSWILALKAAEKYFGIQEGARIGVRLLLALQEMRFARRSVFSFNAPQCAGCSMYLTEHERRLTTSIGALRRGRLGPAQAEMIMLCEGHDASVVLSAFSELVVMLPRLEQVALEVKC